MVDIPDIVCLEPVYPSREHNESVWVECTLEWIPEREVFVDRTSEPSWVLDEHAHHDSSYFVRGAEFDSLEEAYDAALRGRTKMPDTPLVVHQE